MANNNAIRIIQLVLAILGLILESSSRQGSDWFVVFSFVLALIYMLIVVVGWAVGSNVFTGRNQIIVEIVLAVLLLVAMIIVTLNYLGDVVHVMAIVCGFVLAALLVITAYNG